jgi:hypothetical protein
MLPPIAIREASLKACEAPHITGSLSRCGKCDGASAGARTPLRVEIEIVRVKRIDPAASKPRFQLRDGSVELMKVLSLGRRELRSCCACPIVPS